jgi:hypothetical protein
MFKINRVDSLTYLALLIGLTIDHITTYIGINYFNLYEANAIARSLMNLGIWSYVDIIICLIFIKSLQFIVSRYKEGKILLIFPLLTGILRIMVGISNLLLFF